MTTTTSASSAALRAFSTKQSEWNAQSAPRQLSRVDVTSGQIVAFSGTSASVPRSPVSDARENAMIRAKVPRVLARGQAALGGGALQMMVADIVRAALEQRERHRELQRIAHERQVALEQLVLQRLGAGGDDHLAAVEQRGNEIREGLAGAGAGFGDQCGPPADRGGNGIGHGQLLRAKAEARKRAGQHAAVTQDRGQPRIGGIVGGASGTIAISARPAARRALTAPPGAANAVSVGAVHLSSRSWVGAPWPWRSGALLLPAASIARTASDRSLNTS